MQEKLLQRGRILLFAVLSVLASVSLAAADGTKSFPPVLFVHGGAGSGAQFESQAMRFITNGYPSTLIEVFEYDSQFLTKTFDQTLVALDEKVSEIIQRTGAAQLDVLGHSLGTRVMQSYLATPERARKVAHYVNVDGYPAAAPPGGVPTLAVWAGVGAPNRAITGATNVTIPNQTHVQVATSAEAFAAYYEFFTGAAPRTRAIEPAVGAPIEVSGRTVLFPENTGAAGARVSVFEVVASTGLRAAEMPVATFDIAASGSFGPFVAKPATYYEFVVAREGASPHHFFFEPFVRSDRLLRLNVSRPGQGLDGRVDRSPRHVAVTVVRNKEFWGDKGAENDVLSLAGTNVINAAVSPQSNRTISVFAFDSGADGASDLTKPLATIYGTAFMTGVDLFLPSDATRTLPIVLTPRGKAAATRTVNVPAIPSSAGRITVYLWDYE